MNVVETHGLGKRYGRAWALRDCTLAVPAGRVVALVGPNGAGKTTLLHIIVGLSSATTGTVQVLGGSEPGSDEALRGISFVAQDTPLYTTLSVRDTLHLAASMSDAWDQSDAVNHLRALGIPLERRVGKLSGGQRAQVALAVALARHPALLVLDEPLARLDPLARHDFTAMLMAAVSEHGIGVVFSSHVVSELERVCDYLIVLGRGAVQIAGEVDDLIAGHRLWTGDVKDVEAVTAAHSVVHVTRSERQAHLLVRTPSTTPEPPRWQSHETNLEEIILGYLRSPAASTLPGPRRSAVPA